MSTDRVSVPRPLQVSSFAVFVLAAVAAGAGLLVPGIYREESVLVAQALGQDLLTLVVALPVLLVALSTAVRGSLRGYVLWLGVVGYLLYTYASYAFMLAFTELFLVHVALFSLALATFVGGLLHLDPERVRSAVRIPTVRPFVAFEVLVAVLVGGLWLGVVVPASLAGSVPEPIVEAGLRTNAIYVLDLAVVVPGFALAAYWLARGRAWGYVLTGVLLVKGSTLGLAVLAMIAFMLLDGFAVPAVQVGIFGALSALGLWLLARFLLAIEEDAGAEPTPPQSAVAPGAR